MCTQYGWNFQPGWQLRNPNSLQPKQEPHDTIPGPRQSRELATHVGRRQVMKKVLRRDWCKLLHFSTCMKDPHSKHCLSSNLHVDPHRTRPDIAMIGNKNSFMHLSTTCVSAKLILYPVHQLSPTAEVCKRQTLQDRMA